MPPPLSTAPSSSPILPPPDPACHPAPPTAAMGAAPLSRTTERPRSTPPPWSCTIPLPTVPRGVLQTKDPCLWGGEGWAQKATGRPLETLLQLLAASPSFAQPRDPSRICISPVACFVQPAFSPARRCHPQVRKEAPGRAPRRILLPVGRTLVGRCARPKAMVATIRSIPLRRQKAALAMPPSVPSTGGLLHLT